MTVLPFEILLLLFGEVSVRLDAELAFLVIIQFVGVGRGYEQRGLCLLGRFVRSNAEGHQAGRRIADEAVGKIFVLAVSIVNLLACGLAQVAVLGFQSQQPLGFADFGIFHIVLDDINDNGHIAYVHRHADHIQPAVQIA